MGYEIVANHIAEGIVKKGHDVTLYASGDSLTSGKLRWAVLNIDTISRNACREKAERLFTVQKMVNDYEEI